MHRHHILPKHLLELGRDPRIDPKVGDVVLAHGRERTIHCLYEDDRYGWATESPLASGIYSIAAWRRWAKDGEVIYRADGAAELKAEKTDV